MDNAALISPEAARNGEVALVRPSGRTTRQPHVAIIGAGLSGIGAGAQLKRAGLTDFVLFEKAATLGGTWRDNHYPGLACDVRSPFYTWTFAPNPNWTSLLPKQREILDYAQHTADAEGISSHIRFNTEVMSAVWDDNGWVLTTADGKRERFDFLITAVGFLHYPKTPNIPGIEDFRGPVLHTAQWDDTVDYRGKRVGVIGNGSSGTQIIGEIAKDTQQLFAFIRTPQWIYRIQDAPFGRSWRFTRRWIPGMWRRTWQTYRKNNDAYVRIFTDDGPERAQFQKDVREYLSTTVRDPELRAKLTPDYEPGCKRIVVSSTFYDAVQLPHVEVVRDPIKMIEAGGVWTADEALRELDILVVATGYDTQAFLTHVDIVGNEGRSIQEEWKDGLRTYKAVALDGYPNMFMLGGPHAPFGTISFILSGQLQAGYAVQWIQKWAEGEFDVAEPTKAAVDEFTAEVRGKADKTLWGTGCVSWYLDAAGVPSPWPFSAPRFREEMSRLRADHFRLEKRDTPSNGVSYSQRVRSPADASPTAKPSFTKP